MEEIMEKKKKSNWLIIVAIVYTIVAIGLSVWQVKSRMDSDPVTAVISHNVRTGSSSSNRRYTSYVMYSYEGKVYKNIEYGHTKKLRNARAGQTIKIYVNREDPTKIDANEPAILIGWLMFFEIAIILAVITERRARKSADNQ